MSTIRAAALDAAICEALWLAAWKFGGMSLTLDALSEQMAQADMDRYPYTVGRLKRETRHRLQKLRAAGRIEQSSRGLWQIVGGAQ